MCGKECWAALAARGSAITLTSQVVADARATGPSGSSTPGEGIVRSATGRLL